MNEKIKVCNNLDEVTEFLHEHKELKVCLYLAYKTIDEWEKSTSRIYMNQISNNFAYLPVNIEKDNIELIRKIYELSEKNDQIVAINQTQPHKSNPILKEWFDNQNLPNIDSLVKNQDKKMICYNLNGPAFTGWFEDEVCRFNNKLVIVFGVGGVGEPIARDIARKKCKKLYLVDINSKESLVKELSKETEVYYAKKISDVNFEIHGGGTSNEDIKDGILEMSINLQRELKEELNLDLNDIQYKMNYLECPSEKQIYKIDMSKIKELKFYN